jgi:hypothetical protein
LSVIVGVVAIAVMAVVALFCAAMILVAIGWAVWTAGYIVWGVVRVFAAGVKRGLGR